MKNARTAAEPMRILPTTISPILLMMELTNDYYNHAILGSPFKGPHKIKNPYLIKLSEIYRQSGRRQIYFAVKSYKLEITKRRGPCVAILNYCTQSIIVCSSLSPQRKMNKSEIILNIEECYPFGQAVNQRLKIKVRRLVPFASQDEYAFLKKKIEVLRNLREVGLVQLLSVLEDEDNFHLIYEYVPLRLRFDRLEHQFLLRSQLQDICAELQKKNTVAIFEPFNLGLSQRNQIKYYLDISHISFHQEQPQLLKVAHAFQINRLIDCLSRQPSSTKTEPVYYSSVDKDTPKKLEQSLQRIPRKNNLKSTGATEGPIQMLKKIEDRLSELRKITKKYTPAMRETFKSKDQLRETVKQNWKAEKVDGRKMSGHTTYTSLFMSKDASKRKNTGCLKNNPTNIFTEFAKTSSPILPKEAAKAEPKKIKQPATKTDFEQIQKKQFQSYFAAKQPYVHQFLDILGDQQQPAPLYQEPPKKTVTILQPQKPLNFSVQQKRSSSPADSGSHSINSPPKYTECSQLKDRVTLSIKNSDMAMMRFRKNSVALSKK